MSRAFYDVGTYRNALVQIAKMGDVLDPESYTLPHNDNSCATSFSEDKLIVFTPDVDAYQCIRLSAFSGQDRESNNSEKDRFDLAVGDCFGMLINRWTLEECMCKGTFKNRWKRIDPSVGMENELQLEAGLTTFHGVVLNAFEADHFRRLERRLRRHVDRRWAVNSQVTLQEFKDLSGDEEEYRTTIFEIVRCEASARWKSNFGTSWRDDMDAANGGLK
jgi:hypothetical protein